MLLMNLEVMAVAFEDAGLQVLCSNRRKSAQEYFDEIGLCLVIDTKLCRAYMK